jgi:hypothetical protein
MGNGHNPDMRRYKCELCLGQDGDEILDPYTGGAYRVRVTRALPLKRRAPGSGEWRVELICEHCTDTIQRASGAAGGSIRLYSPEESFREARRRDWEITRLNCKTKSIVRHYARFRMDDDLDLPLHAITGTDGGSK